MAALVRIARLLSLALLLQLFAGVPVESKYVSNKKLNVLLLSVFPIGHLTNVLRVGEELAVRGHNVTMLVVPNKADQEKYSDMIEKTGVHFWDVSSEDLAQLNITQVGGGAKDSFRDSMLLNVKPYMTSLSVLLASHLNGSLAAGDWDILLGSDLVSPLLSCLLAPYDIPLVTVGSNFQLYSHASPHWPWPDLFHGAASDDMGFVGRAMSTVSGFIFSTAFHRVFGESFNAVSEYCPALGNRDLVGSISVRHPHIVAAVMGFEYPRTISPMTHYVGTLVPKSPPPVVGQLEEWLTSKPKGSVVYISTGSVMPLDKNIGQAFLEGVMSTNYSLLWALRKSNQWILDGLDMDPDRVLVSDWTPQFSVLGSEAIHSAILHAGFNGLSEALWNGVPVVVIPQILEQQYNAGRVHYNGLGILLDANSLSSSKITESLKALDTGEYRSNVARLQKVIRMAGGVERSADLVEFYEDVGYEHLVPAYAKYNWSWVQYYNADVYVLIVLTLVVVLLCLRTCCKYVYEKCSSRTHKKKD